jgi:hypothetical protein
MLKLQLRESRPGSIVAALLALGLTLGPVAPSFAGLIPGSGKGAARNDCYNEFDVAGVDTTASTVQCAEGSPGCDQDGLPNDVCDFKVALCPNQTDPNVPGCTPAPPLTSLKIKSVGGPGKVKIITLPPAPADLSGTTCGTAVDILVPLKVLHNGKKKARRAILIVKAKSSGTPKADPDKLTLVCNPPAPIVHCTTANPAGGPDELDLSSGETGSDLDNGWTGISHNFPTPPRSMVTLCLSGCDASTNPVCDATGATGTDLNSDTFGLPLPLIAQGVPVCVINAYQPGDLTAKINVQTGEIPESNPLAVNLFSKVHLTSASQVCPRCKGSGAPAFGGTGTCDGGPNLGQSCVVDSVLSVVGSQGNPLYGLSKTCVPSPGQLAGTLNIKLRLSTGTQTLTGPKPCTAQPGEPTGVPVQDDNCAGTPCNATCTGSACNSHDAQGRCIDARGGISQLCCAGNTLSPCFATANGGSIVRTGTPDPPAPVWPDPTYPKTSTNGILVTTFCEASTGTTTIDATAGLPGPGALILPGTQIQRKNQ